MSHKVLGVISKVTELKIYVALPQNRLVSIDVTAISDTYTAKLKAVVNRKIDPETINSLFDLFKVGQIVVLAKHNSTWSMKPAHVNQDILKHTFTYETIFCACLAEVEDHGYKLELGISGVDAFLHAKESKIKIQPEFGRIFFVKIAPDCDLNSRVLRVNQFELNSHKIRKNSTNFDHLMPGTLIESKVEKDKIALVGKIGAISFQVPFSHCETIDDVSSVNARIIEISQENKSVIASVLPHLVDIKRYQFGFPAQTKTGLLLKDCQLTAVFSSFLLLQGPEERLISVQKKEISKGTLNSLRVGSKYACRITGFSLFDNRFTGSMIDSKLKADYMDSHAIQPGDVLTIKPDLDKLTEKGMIVAISDQINGYIQAMHFFDISVKSPRDIFAKKSKLRCRVLGFDPNYNSFVLTARMSLVDSHLPLLGPQCDLAKEYICYVVKRNEKSLLCAGALNTMGYIAGGELPTGWFAEGLYPLGTAVRCRIVTVRSTEPRCFYQLAMASSGLVEHEELAEKKSNSSIQIGQVFDCRISAVRETDILVELLLKKKQTVLAILPFIHWSDSAMLNRQMIAHVDELEMGSKLARKVVVLDHTPDGRPMVSAKALFVAQAELDPIMGSIPSPGIENFFAGVSDSLTLKPGMQCIGWVTRHEAYGVFLRFPGGQSALAPIRLLCDKPQDQPKEIWEQLLPLGHTVQCKVEKVTEETTKKKVLVSLRGQDVASYQGMSSVMAWLADQQLLVYTQAPVGELVQFIQSKQKADYLLGKTDQGQLARVAKSLIDGKAYKQGKCFVLPNRATCKYLELAPAPSEEAEIPSPGVTVSARVLWRAVPEDQLQDDSFLIVQLSAPYSSTLGLLPAQTCLNQWEDNPAELTAPQITVGSQVEVQVVSRKSHSLVSCSYACPADDDSHDRMKPVKEGDQVPAGEFKFVCVSGDNFILQRGRQRFVCPLVDWSLRAKACLKLIDDPPEKFSTLAQPNRTVYILPGNRVTFMPPVKVGSKIVAKLLPDRSPKHQTLAITPRCQLGYLHNLLWNTEKKYPHYLVELLVVGKHSQDQLVLTSFAKRESVIYGRIKEGQSLAGLVKYRTKHGLVVSVASFQDLLVPLSKPTIKSLSNIDYSPGARVELVVSDDQNNVAHLAQQTLESSSESVTELVNFLSKHKMEHFASKASKKHSDGNVDGPGPVKRCKLDSIMDKYSEFAMDSDEESEESNKASKKPQEENDAMDVDEPVAKVDEILAPFVSEILALSPVSVTLQDLSIERCEMAVRNRPLDGAKWIQFMLFHLQAGQLDLSRSTMERGLTALSRSPSEVTDKSRAHILMMAVALESKLSSQLVSNSVLAKRLNLGLCNSSAARVQAEQEQLERVSALIDRLSRLNQNWAMRRLSVMLVELEQFDLAERVARNLVKGSKAHDPDDWLNLIMVRMRAGLVESAREAQANAAKLIRIGMVPKLACGAAHLEIKYGNIDRGLKLLEEQIQAHPQRKEIHVEYVRGLIDSARVKEARLAADKACTIVKNLDRKELDRLFVFESS